MGKPNKMGKVRVDNSIINVETFSLSHVKINDRKGVAEEHGLFSIEYVPEGTTFATTIEANNIDVGEMRLLLTALEMRNSRIGKNGMVDIRIKDIEPNGVIPKLKEDEEVIKILLENLIGDRDANI